MFFSNCSNTLIQYFYARRIKGIFSWYYRDDANHNEFDLNDDKLLRVAKPLYGLSDSGDRWHHTYREHRLKDLSMTRSNVDPSLYYKDDKDELI